MSFAGTAVSAELKIFKVSAVDLSAGFMLWHIANAQLCWLPDYWPAVRPEHVRRAINSYRERERRLGK